MQYIKVNNTWEPVCRLYKKINNTWVLISEADFILYASSRICFRRDSGGFLKIVGLQNISSETCRFKSIYNNTIDVTNQSLWSVISGNTYGSINNGLLTINPIANNSDMIIKSQYNELFAIKDVNVTYQSGSTTDVEVNSFVNESGNTVTETIILTENSDGSSEEHTTTIILDENGDTLGSSEIDVYNNNDGSFNSTTTNFDENGTATDAINISGDTQGNIDTQQIEYDESGNSIVTGYEIDTTGSNGEGKDITGDGVNTEFIPFADNNCGFVCHIKFDTKKEDQPRPPLVEDTEDTGSNWLYNIMSAKSPFKGESSWPGFDIRWAISKSNASNGSLQFRYSSISASSTTARSLNGKNEDGTSSGSTYDLIITYDPEFVLPTSRTTFSVVSPNGCISSIGTNITFASNNIDFTLGYATNQQNEPYRYSNVTIHEFSITKICSSEIIVPSEPVITCEGEEVIIVCETTNASIYYRLGTLGNYALYNMPILISADTEVYAYAELMGQTSDIVSATCIYNNGIEEPTIDCDGEYITIVSETPSVDIYYKLNDASAYTMYTSSIQISADTTVYAYAELNTKTSNVISATCIYEPGIKTPVITCDNNIINIICATFGSNIYYKLDISENYALYSEPLIISADTIVFAYSELNGESSTTVSQLCIYENIHDYSEDYLTFRIISGGTVAWKAIGTGHTDTIQYSINNGVWTSIQANSTPSTIAVSSSDIVRFKGNNISYAKDKNNYAGFEGGTAYFNIEGNIMSLIYGDNFFDNQKFSGGTYNFCSIFKKSHAVSAENLILPASALTNYAYRAMFSYCTDLVTAPALPARKLSTGCYWYMFEYCAISNAPELNASALTNECYGNMFINCSNLNYIKCLAVSGLTANKALQDWVKNVSSTGTFVKDSNAIWSVGNSGIPVNWNVCDDIVLFPPMISFDGDDVEITCPTSAATIYYRFNQEGDYSVYISAITLSAETLVEAYSELGNQTSNVTELNCEYISNIPLSASNRNITKWTYNNQEIETPYSVNAIDGHSSNYAKGNFNFTTNVNLRQVQPTYLWFQHADQSADIYVDDVKVETHWGGYNAFFSDITNYIHKGTNNIKVTLCNTTRNTLAPAAGDFNFNATLGNVKLFTSPVIPDMEYGYDGFHVTSDVSDSSATITVKTSIPVGAEVVCSIDDDNYHFTDTQNSTGEEMIFSAIVQNPHLWNGTSDPHLYNIKLEIYHNNELYHKYERPYGLRYYSYVIDNTNVLPNNESYTGFLLNGAPYFLRGVCMHDDIEGRANALTSGDVETTFSIIQELGCNFIRLAHYPHPKEIYDKCDEFGIIVQTEAPCVNKLQSTMPEEYYTHLTGQYEDMVNQHYNHPCIMFWGLSNETTTDDKDFGKAKIEEYTALIKSMDSERLVGYVMSHSYNNPSSYYNNPDVDWFGGNIYVGWYIDKASNDPTSQLNTRVNNIITTLHKPLAFSEYGCGGTQRCHSEDPQTTTTKGNYERHDIEYQMWLHEGHIAAIRNFPQLLFTAQWQLFDIAVSNRNEGYIICLDGETTSTDDNLRRLNDKGLVERDHITKKDTFYIYKAEWSNETFVHICGKDYTRMVDRVIKCYTNDGNSLSLYVNDTFIETVSVTNHIATFTSRTFYSGDVVRVEGATTNDMFTFA